MADRKLTVDAVSLQARSPVLVQTGAHVNLELWRKVGIHVTEKRGPREGSATSTPSGGALRQRAVAHTP